MIVQGILADTVLGLRLEFQLLPDFQTGGSIDVSKYNDGERGGVVKVRAKINKVDNKTLAITEIPFGKTVTSVCDSIVKASEKGKIKIRKVEDLTSEKVEILVHLAPGVSSDKTIDALYAFTDCEALTSFYVNAAVLPEGMFYECKALETVTIGPDVNEIGEFAFRDTAIATFKVDVGNKAYKVQNANYILSADGATVGGSCPHPHR